MRAMLAVSCLLCLLVPFVQANAVAQEPPASFLRRPDIHGDKIVFTAEGDLWIASIRDGQARRLTTHPGTETWARFSPDGTLIAFSGQYDGGTDVYVIPAEGGEPKRLTYAPYGARVQGWTPDGKSVLYRTWRPNPQRDNCLFTVPVAGGRPTMLPIPRAQDAALNPNGKLLAYVPVSAEWQHWFHYKGGEADDIWLADLSNHTFRRLTTYQGVDTTPVWAQGQLYFISERAGIANLFRLDIATRSVMQVTHYADYEARYPSSDGKLIVMQHGRGLAIYDPATGKASDLKIMLTRDRIHARPRRVPITARLNWVSVGPTGKRLLIESRGQILSVPVEHGDARALAGASGYRCQFPAWSADGKQIAFVSDRSGEEQVWVMPSSGPGQPRQLTRDHNGPLGMLTWSPDGKWIATSDREMRIWLVRVATGEMVLVDQADRGGSYNRVNWSYRFSPDGKWLTYAKTEPNWNDAIYLYDIEGRKKVPVTSAEMNSFAPAFDQDGKYLLFLSDRELDPIGSGPTRYFGFDRTTRVSMVPLSASTPSPFLPEDDEEGTDQAASGEPAKPAEPAAKDAKPDEKKAPQTWPDKLPSVKVDLDGIQDRVVDVPVPAARYQQVEMVADRILLLVDPAIPDAGSPNGRNQLLAFDMKKKRPNETTTIVDHLHGMDVSADGKKLLLHIGGDWAVVDANTGPVGPGVAKVDLGGITIQVDPPAEWREIFAEAWRIARDFFYDPGMHGVDWEAVRRKYADQVNGIADRSDLNEIIGDMMAELNVGHAYVGGGDIDAGARPMPMGYLGADLEPVEGADAYRIAKLYPGDGFELDTRSPLLAPGVKVKEGNYILAVAGVPVRRDQDIQALLIGTASRTISLTVNSKPQMEGSHDVLVKPLASEDRLRYFAWVSEKREYVLKHGGPNIAYIHIPDMGDGGLREFAKHYYANLNKDGIIYDVRYNGGGYISAMLLLQMASKPYSYFKPRYGASWTREDWAFPGYSVALCGETSGSNAEEFCDAFQRLKLGPVIGVRTWGGEVGSGGGYALIDGGQIYVPNYAAWSPDGKWIIEGTGVHPDIMVEQDPQAVMEGRDPQLDRAIAYLKEEIAKRPVPRPTHPPFPNKAVSASADMAAHASEP